MQRRVCKNFQFNEKTHDFHCLIARVEPRLFHTSVTTRNTSSSVLQAEGQSSACGAAWQRTASGLSSGWKENSWLSNTAMSSNKLPSLMLQMVLPSRRTSCSNMTIPLCTPQENLSLLLHYQVEVLSRPLQSPDLNPIENVGGTMKKALASQCLHRLSADRLWSAVKAE